MRLRNFSPGNEGFSGTSGTMEFFFELNVDLRNVGWGRTSVLLLFFILIKSADGAR
jgi:hypothetical protein